MNIFLVPGHPGNFAATILQSVPRSRILENINTEQRAELDRAIPSGMPIHCWAFKAGINNCNVSMYNSMCVGDAVFFRPNQAGLVSHIGTVCHLLKSATLGNSIWPVTGPQPWEYIYFLKDLRTINLNWDEFKKKLNISPNNALQRTMRLNTAHLQALRQFGSIDGFINSFGSNPASAIPAGTPPTVIRRRPDPPPIQRGTQPEPSPQPRPANTQPAQLDRVFLRKLTDLCEEIEHLKNDSGHQERDHESLVENFLKALGYAPRTEIKYRRGRIDICIEHDGRVLVVIEVKRDWNIVRTNRQLLQQAFNYALEIGGRYVVLTNGDYYAAYDRDQGRSYEEHFIFEFTISALNPQEFQFMAQLNKEYLLSRQSR